MLRCLEHRLLTICCRSHSIIDSTAIDRNPRRFANNSAVYQKSRLWAANTEVSFTIFSPASNVRRPALTLTLHTHSASRKIDVYSCLSFSRTRELRIVQSFLLPFILIPFFAAICPQGKRESSADRVLHNLPARQQVSALLHEMKRPTAEVSLPVHANRKREVWQPLPCAQQSHS